MAKIPSVKAVIVNKGQIALKVRVPGTQPAKYKFKSIDEKIPVKQWNSKAGQVKSGYLDSEYINRKIFDERDKLVIAFEADRKLNIPFTEAHIIARMTGAGIDYQDFYAFCREQIGFYDNKETRRSYEAEVSKLEQFTPALSFVDITFKWLQRYEKHMRDKLENSDNTIWKSFKFMNRMLNLAKKIGVIKDNPFAEYDRGKYKQGIPLYLEWSEVQQLHRAIAEKPMTNLVRLTGYYSLLSYYSGLRFGDTVSFDYKTKVIEDTTGRRLVLYAAKNGEIVSIAFTKYITEVVDFIKNKPIVISNQDFNSNLKIIAGIAELSKDITSHTGRHSFAMRCAELGMSIDDVQKLLGHNKRSSTEIYFRIKNRRLDDVMKKWD